MPNIERMKDQLVQWNLLDQVWKLVDSGFTLVTAIDLIYNAHTRGNAFTAMSYLNR